MHGRIFADIVLSMMIRGLGTHLDEIPSKPNKADAEEALFQELKRLGVLSSEAVVADLWTMDLSLLDGYGMQEYWLVHARPKTLGMKKELFGARFTNKVEERTVPESGDKKMMVKVSDGFLGLAAAVILIQDGCFI